MALPESPSLSEGTITIFNPQKFHRPVTLLYKQSDGSVKKVLKRMMPGKNQLDEVEYQALRLACGDVDPNCYIRETAGLFVGGTGLRVEDNLSPLMARVKAGKLPFKDVNPDPDNPQVELRNGFAWDQRDAVAIAKSIVFTVEEAEVLLAKQGKTTLKPGEAKDYAAKLTQDLIARLYDEVKFSTAKTALQARLTLQQQFDRGLITKKEMEYASEYKSYTGAIKSEGIDVLQKLQTLNSEKAVEYIERLDPAPYGSQKTLVKIYDAEKRKTVRAAARARLIGAYFYPKDATTGEQQELITEENVDDFLGGRI